MLCKIYITFTLQKNQFLNSTFREAAKNCFFLRIIPKPADPPPHRHFFGLKIWIWAKFRYYLKFLSFCNVIFFVRRGVRSDAQLSSTQTRFQKCSQSGKNGSKHPMLSISMAYNVISCKKVKRNTQKIKFADFTM